MKRTIGDITVYTQEDGWPHWTQITFRGGLQTDVLSHEEVRDLHYALTRVVALLDAKEKQENQGLS